jgi:hypothetical protein
LILDIISYYVRISVIRRDLQMNKCELDCDNTQGLLEEIENIIQFHAERLNTQIEMLKGYEDVSEVLIALADCILCWSVDLLAEVEPYMSDCDSDSLSHKFAWVNYSLSKHLGTASFLIRPEKDQ